MTSLVEEKETGRIEAFSDGVFRDLRRPLGLLDRHGQERLKRSSRRIAMELFPAVRR